jgi:NNP family nitrate/nitrite transporter-like MFS transporter
MGAQVRLLAAVTSGFFGGGGVVAIYGLLLGGAGYSPALTGWLIAGPAMTGALLRIPTSAMADRVGARRLFMALAALGVLGMFATTASLRAGLGPWPLLGLGALSGCGLATFSLGAAQIGWGTSAERAGLALGLYGGLAHLGPSVALMLLPWVIERVDASWVPAIWAAGSAVGLLIYAAFAYEPERPPRAAAGGGEVDGRVWALALAYFASFGVFVALCGWLPWLFRTTGVGAGKALAFAFLAPTTRIFAGWLTDRWSGASVLAISSVLGAAAAIPLALGHHWAWQIPLAVGLGGMMGSSFGLLPEVAPRALGKASGLVGGLGATGGFVLPPLLGMLVTDALPSRGLGLVSLLAAVTAASAVWLLTREGEGLSGP